MSPASGTTDAVGWVRGLVFVYIAASLVLLFAVRRLRLYPLYLLKSIWVGFTVLAFAWVVIVSGTTNEEFVRRPAGVFDQLARYPGVFHDVYRLDAWWLPLAAWVPLCTAAGALTDARHARAARVVLAAMTAIVLWPAAVLVVRFDWSAYAHFGENYRQAWRIARMGDYFLNSALVSACSVGLVSILSSLAAYGLTRLEFRGRRPIMALLVAAMAVPGSLLIIPLFLMIKGWTLGPFSFANSRVGLSVLYAAISLPFSVFLLSAFYRSLPGELARAALVDGAPPWRVFTDVYFPLSAPGLATVAIFNFLSVWNEYTFALVFVTNAELKTLPVGLYNLQVSQQFAVNWPAMFAGVVILCVPTFLVFVALQERIVAGLTIGGVKE